MSARPRSASFLREAGAGFLLSVAAGALGAALAFALPAEGLARAVVAALGLAYLVRVLVGSSAAPGRVAAVALWCAAAVALWLFGTALPAYVVAHVLMLSLARSLFLHRRLLEAVIDAGLSLLALGFAVWAAVSADSLFLATWCFFLVQAMHVAIPGLAARLSANEDETPRDGANRRFTDALGLADEALRRIAARR